MYRKEREKIMAHELELDAQGKAKMVYFGDTPWHGLGKKIEHAMTSAEAIKEAELDWKVKMVPVYTPDKLIEGRKAVIRETDGRVYNITKDRYLPIQNEEAFNFFDAVTGTNEAKYHTAGSIRNGAMVWMLAKLPDSIAIDGEQIDKFICLLNSHDGSSALKMFFTPIRVVCMNTLSMAESGAANKFYARHTTNINTRMDVARDVLGFAKKYYDNWTVQANKLVTEQLPVLGFEAMMKNAFKADELKELDEMYAPVQKAFSRVEELLTVGKGMDNSHIAGTKWAAYNALVEYIDYEKQPRGGSADNRLKSAWFGTGAAIKERSWNYLLKN